MLLLRTDVLLERATAAGQITSSGIAQRIGVTDSTMWRLIEGRTTPSLRTLVALRRAYEISLDDLVREAA
ncbi:helix-turn-helix domain-containing protein [Streptomyces sp. NPDC058231]|uniref:helix-turn-helix domain-containing protein n=1 Tax=Streptomyces sp. NPDC058231 TaxID=3346392 RepID=UPI0036DFE738